MSTNELLVYCMSGGCFFAFPSFIVSESHSSLLPTSLFARVASRLAALFVLLDHACRSSRKISSHVVMKVLMFDGFALSTSGRELHHSSMLSVESIVLLYRCSFFEVSLKLNHATTVDDVTAVTAVQGAKS